MMTEPNFDFSDALKRLLNGKMLTRRDWPYTPRCYICLTRPFPESAHQRPYIWFRHDDGTSVPWTATHPDLLADDWREVITRVEGDEKRRRNNELPQDIEAGVMPAGKDGG